MSACLAGEKCRYTGDGFDYPELKRLVEEGRAVTVCPEVMGGAPVPRNPCEIKGGNGFDVLEGRAHVFDNRGRDKTSIFIDGATKVLEMARKTGVRVAILKERSPSCGSTEIYDGTFTGNKVPGCGCTVALLLKEGIQVFSEENYSKEHLFYF